MPSERTEIRDKYHYYSGCVDNTTAEFQAFNGIPKINQFRWKGGSLVQALHVRPQERKKWKQMAKLGLV